MAMPLYSNCRFFSVKYEFKSGNRLDDGAFYDRPSGRTCEIKTEMFLIDYLENFDHLLFR